MKAKESTERFMGHPDFEVLFRWFDATVECLTFNILIDDTEHSDKVVSGKE